MIEVLVVDDSPVIRKVASRILEGLHLRAKEAPDGESALAECEKRMPDAILLDWNMPQMDGLAFLGALRKMPGGDAPKVVYCTSDYEVGLIARAKYAGADDHMMKPFDQSILRGKLMEMGLV